MTMAVSGATPWDTTPADAPGATAGRHDRQRTQTAPSAGALNAFAATLASMLAPAIPLGTSTPNEEGTSDLDAPAMDAATGSSAGNGSVDADASNNSGIGSASTSVTGAGTSVGSDSRPAYAAANDARSVANGAPVTDVNSDTDALNPEFRTRLNRVVSRMKDELGHDVELVEGYRPQSRQDFLYAQGRSRSGPVVTWTRSSKHTLGLAADLKIDGSYGNPAAYQQLARIAAQEGLRTLGSRDPGHVELPSRGAAAAWGSGVVTANLDQNAARALELALSSDGMRDSGTDADSARGDTDGINGLLSRATRGSAAPAQSAVSYGGASAGFGGASGGTQNGGAQNGGAQNDQRGSDPRRAQRDAIAATSSDQSGGVASVARVADVASVAQVAQVAQVAVPGSAAHPGVHQSTHAAADAPLPPTGALSAARVGHLLDVRDATPAQPLSHVTLDLDNATGGSDRITVQLRSGAVDTSIALGDGSRADKVSLRVGELQHALEQHGLDTGSIQVAQAGTDTSAGWTPRQGGDQRGADQRPTPNNRDHRQDADDSRQRSRREQQGEKK